MTSGTSNVEATGDLDKGRLGAGVKVRSEWVSERAEGEELEVH